MACADDGAPRLISDLTAELVAGGYAADETIAALERALGETDDQHIGLGITTALADAREVRRRVRTLVNATRGLA